MTKRRTAALGLASLVCGLAAHHPAQAYGGSAWGPLSMVTIYRGSTRTGALLQLSATFTNNDNCAHPENLFIDFSTAESPDGKSLYAMALAAVVSEKSVSVGTLGCSSEGFPLVYGINVR